MLLILKRGGITNESSNSDIDPIGQWVRDYWGVALGAMHGVRAEGVHQDYLLGRSVGSSIDAVAGIQCVHERIKGGPSKWQR